VANRVLARNLKSIEHVHSAEERHHARVGHALRAAGLSYANGAVLSSRTMLASKEEKRQAKDDSGAIAVDMETAALASEALARGLGFVCVRTVIDEIDDELPMIELDGTGRVRPLAAMRYLATNPRALLLLPRTMRNMARATRSIADALEAIAKELSNAAPG